MEERTRAPAGARRSAEGSGRERRADRCSRPKRGGATNARRRMSGIAAVVTKSAMPTTRTRRRARSLQGRVDVEPPDATGETARRRSDDDGKGPTQTAVPAAACPTVGANYRSILASHGRGYRGSTDATGWLEVRARLLWNIRGRVCGYHAVVYPGSGLFGEITPLLLHV